MGDQKKKKETLDQLIESYNNKSTYLPVETKHNMKHK